MTCKTTLCSIIKQPTAKQQKRLSSLKRKVLSWLRKLLNMDYRTYYCRFYVKSGHFATRLMLPFFLRGKDEGSVDEAIFNIIKSIHLSEWYSLDGMESKILCVRDADTVEHTVKEDFLAGTAVTLDVVAGKYFGCLEETLSGEGIKIRVLKVSGHEGKETNFKMDAVLLTPGLENLPALFPFPALRLE